MVPIKVARKTSEQAQQIGGLADFSGNIHYGDGSTEPANLTFYTWTEIPVLIVTFQSFYLNIR